MNANDGWSKDKPTTPGIYQVRGFNLFVPKNRQVIATVVVAVSKDKRDKKQLVNNLHESTSEGDHSEWSRLSDMSDEFEWRGPFVLKEEPK